jgi:hypothetical protein
VPDKNNPFLLIIHHDLLPAQHRVHRFQIKNSLAEALNRLVWVIPLLSGIGFILILTIGPEDPEKNAASRIWFAVLAAGLLWIGAACVWAWFRRPDWRTVACQIDQATNPHNLVAIAYEHSCSKAPSLFAEFAIRRGLDLLNSYGMENFKPPAVSVSGRRIVSGVLVLVLLWGLSLWISSPEGLSGSSDGEETIISKSQGTIQPLQDRPREMQAVLQPTVRESAAFNQSASNRSMQYEAMQKISLLSGLSTKTFSYPEQAGAQPSSASPTQSGGSVSARSQDTSQKVDAAVRISPKTGKTGRKAEPPVQQDTLSNASQKGTAGKSPDAESDIKAVMAAGGLEELPEQEDAFWDRQQQQQNAPSGIGQRPELSDRLSAPNRELGMSGKPGDKGGEGRGGPGMIKKSRATASALSATTIPVQVKGQTQPGKSKSYTQSLPLSGAESNAVLQEQAYRPAEEGDVCVYIPDSQWNLTIENYFLNLRKVNF